MINVECNVILMANFKYCLSMHYKSAYSRRNYILYLFCCIGIYILVYVAYIGIFSIYLILY